MLAEQFSRFGDIESIKLFSQKNYAFVTLKTVEDAVYAKKGLHGTVLGGLAVRIEFARGAQDGRPNPHAEIDEKDLNEKERQTEEKIIYQDKGQKDGKQEKKAAATKVVTSDDISRHSSDVPKGNKNGDPSEVLWIGFPLHLKIDEKKLHKLFAPFGGVEKITTFPGRTYAFVRFQNVKAASRAKDALQGKLFDDPRVSISFAKSEVGPVDNFHANSELRPPSPLKAGTRFISSTSVKDEEGTSLFLSNSSFKVGTESNNFSIASPRKEEIFPPIAPLPSFGSLTSRSEPPHAGKESHWSSSHFFPARSGTGINDKPYSPPSQSIEPIVNIDMKDDFSGNAGSKHVPKAELDKGTQVLQKDKFSEIKELKADDNWMLREYSNIRDQKRARFEMENPNGGALFSLGSPSAISDKLRSQGEDGDAKRPRLANEHFWVEAKDNKPTDYANERVPLPPHDMWDDQVLVSSGLLGRTPVVSDKEKEVNVSLVSKENLETKDGSHRGLLGRMPPADSTVDQPLVSQSEHVLVESPISPARTDAGSPSCPPPKDVFRWEGTIAKGGMEVCRCRCFPATKEIDVMFPDILNCTARTSLDMLAQYISQVRDFAVVLFMPQGVPDVAPYQELMAFLADKKRAAVCKLSEENTLFLVPPSDFVEQFLNVPKSNNILGVVLGQQQQRSQSSQTSTDHSVSLTSQQTFDSKRQGHQKLDTYAMPEDPGTIPVHSVEMKTVKSSSQQIGYQLESSKLDHGGSMSFENMLCKNRLGPDVAQDNEVATDSGRISYGTQGSKPFMPEHQAHEKNPLPDNRSLSFQISGNLPMPIPMPLPIPHGLQMFGNPNLPPGGKMPPHQDPVMLPRPPMFFPSRTAEQLPMPGSNQTISDSQKAVGSFAFPERPWSVPIVPHSLPMTQMNPPMVHPQPSFSYGPTAQQQFPAFDGRQQDGPAQPSSFAFRPTATNTRSLPSPYPLASESGPRPPSLPLGLPSLDSTLRPPVPPMGTAAADRDKQGSEADQQQAFQNALAGMHNPNSSEEDQKKFRATVELAAALLQQLQQQTKL
ncbi:hypothetical protein GOP47_0000369 [Adiantum capillus-veneris]|uniref:RRM domain-containing protein n=1 Tax=Adiantum capillus-veneris TaxID=13818 RepID=A0A9D4VDU0_ADICA|nr:hypothetical protein GOP47_0000369 [Adiantum capillus-veneris]